MSVSVDEGLKELQRRLGDPNSVLCDSDVDVEVNGDEVNISMRLYFCSKEAVENLASEMAEFLLKRRGLINEGSSPL